MSETTALTTTTPNTEVVRMGFGDVSSFEYIQRVAKVFNASALVPETFRGPQNLGNCVIALDMANRMKANPLAVMQQIYIVHGKPSWSSQFIIACINTCGRYSPLRFKIEGTGDDKTCTAWAIELETGERLEGSPVSIKMAKSQGWFAKNGSKWPDMPDLMLKYRAATFFGRMYSPELLMGMKAEDEVIDVEAVEVTPPSKFKKPEKILQEAAATTTVSATSAETVTVTVEASEPAPEPADDIPFTAPNPTPPTATEQNSTERTTPSSSSVTSATKVEVPTTSPSPAASSSAPAAPKAETAVKTPVKTAPELIDEIVAKMERDGVSEAQLCAIVQSTYKSKTEKLSDMMSLPQRLLLQRLNQINNGWEGLAALIKQPKA